MATRKKKLKKAEVLDLILTLQASGNITVEMLLNFAEQINGGPFTEPSATKPKAITMAKMKKAVLAKFGCKSVTELRKNRTFEMAFTGEKVSLKSTEDWRIQYRKWVAVPEDERNQSGETCINGIDVLENFRPWHISVLIPQQRLKAMSKVHSETWQRNITQMSVEMHGSLSDCKRCAIPFWP